MPWVLICSVAGLAGGVGGGGREAEPGATGQDIRPLPEEPGQVTTGDCCWRPIVVCRYPLALQSGLQCKIIMGFGKIVCERLEKRLQVHRAKVGVLGVLKIWITFST